MTEQFKNILIIKPSSLGDIVMALPALSALRRNFPDARISWLVRPEFASLLEGHPHLNDIILFDRKFFGKAWYSRHALGAILRLIMKLHRSRFDLVVDLQGLFRTACLGWLSGCKNRFGMANAREFAPVFYTHKTEQDKDNPHVVDYYLRIIRDTGASDIRVEWVFGQDANMVDSVESLLADHGVKGDNYAVLIPGSAHSGKCWPAERFARLADRISSQFGLSIVVIGAESEKAIAKQLEAATDVAIANLAGLTSLRELIYLLKAAKLVVSNDTGPGHIAAALGMPLVLIFGWSNPVRLFPYGRKECVAANEPYSRGLKLSSDDPKHDIGVITVDEVYQKVCEQLGEGQQ